MSWHRQAACKGQDPRLFDGTVPADTDRALGYCRICPVRAECAQEGRGLPGVWGGRVNGKILTPVR